MGFCTNSFLLLYATGAQQDWLHADDSAGVPASFVQLSSGGGGAHLGGHCQTAGTTVRRRFDNLPQHTHLRLQARYHFIDSWEGETAFLQIDGKTAWMDSADSRSGPPGINVAGGATPDARAHSATPQSLWVHLERTTCAHALNGICRTAAALKSVPLPPHT